MSEKKDEYPIATLHTFLQQASKEFRRFRFQAKVNLIGAIVLLIFLLRFLVFVSVDYGPPPFYRPPPLHPIRGENVFYFIHPARPNFILDLILLFASLAFVFWSLDVWLAQERFVSRWGERFEKLEALEKRFLQDEKP